MPCRLAWEAISRSVSGMAQRLLTMPLPEPQNHPLRHEPVQIELHDVVNQD